MLEEGTPAYGIAQQVIHQGYDSLTDKQKYVFDTEIEAAGKRMRRNASDYGDE